MISFFCLHAIINTILNYKVGFIVFYVHTVTVTMVLDCGIHYFITQITIILDKKNYVSDLISDLWGGKPTFKKCVPLNLIFNLK